MALGLGGPGEPPGETDLTPVKSECLGVAAGQQVLESPGAAVLVGMKGKLEALFLH